MSSSTRSLSMPLTLLLAFACALITAGNYFAQPLGGVIAQSFGLPAWATGLPVTLSQIGYCLGLLLVAPLGDRLENRRLLTATLAVAAVALTGAGVAPNSAVFLLACLCIGGAAIAVQAIVVLAASMVSADRRGTTVGRITAGLLLGILLAWPVANLVNQVAGWRALLVVDGVLIASLALVLRGVLPPRQPPQGPGYRALIASLWPLWRTHPELRRRALCQALLFGVFSLFWVSVPQVLQQRHGLGGTALALFGLVGVGGALAAPLAGWLADRGAARPTALAGSLAVAASGIGWALLDSVGMLMACAFCISAGVQACHVISQRRVMALDSLAANRLNSLYIATFFIGGALGSASAAPLLLSASYWPGLVSAGVALLASIRLAR
ncbi:MFS transporter [Pseudomonas tolaasii]|uniref:MFS transporter n=1 Tax=Pseudomonas tolaasii TaxID=29442 RepID=UPI0015A1146E|nr:MFS transporter [Pseudomonas tolaasii]NVZ45750.1 MFS transporter [Pseudomonas tolaasii]NWA49676.1 MFS transporter [Pseudomonas tolaasii]